MDTETKRDGISHCSTKTIEIWKVHHDILQHCLSLKSDTSTNNKAEHRSTIRRLRDKKGASNCPLVMYPPRYIELSHPPSSILLPMKIMTMIMMTVGSSLVNYLKYVDFTIMIPNVDVYDQKRQG